MGVIVKNNIILIMLCVCITNAGEKKSIPLRIAGMLDNMVIQLYGYSEQDKLAATREFEQLIDYMKQQEEKYRISYDKIKQSNLDEEAKKESIKNLENSFNKSIKGIPARIDFLLTIIEAGEQPDNKFVWNTAKVFGISALLALLAYKFVLAPQAPQTKIELPPSTSTQPPASQKSTPALPPKITDSSIPQNLKPDIQQKRELTPQEKALFESRYKTLGLASLWGYLTTAAVYLVPSPMPLGLINGILLAISTATGATALHYKERLDTTLELPKKTILDYVVPR